MRLFKGAAMLYLILFANVILIGMAIAGESPANIVQIRDRWAKINYQTPKGDRESAFEQLSRQAGQARQATPNDPSALIWEGIVLSSLAGEKGGIGALSLVKQARSDFETALKIDPKAQDGAAYTSLGALYYQVPGWPLGFGDETQARQMLRKGLEINPNGIDANYFYGDFLRTHKDWPGAKAAFEKALAAPARPGREIADAGRRQEARAKLAEVSTHLTR